MVMIMSRVFSVFDPSVFTFPWFFFFFFSAFWCAGMGFIFFFFYTFRFLALDYCSILGSSSTSGVLYFFFCLFFFILFFNFFSLFPFVFTVTGHLFFTLGLSLVMWTSIISFYLFFNLGGFLCHLSPSGSPLALSPFIVCLELIRCFIRPVSLSVRLMSNMIAGHLLLGLIGAFRVMFSTGSVIGLVLTCLELGVCVIQAYVFRVLCLLFSLEIHCVKVPFLPLGGS